MQLDLQSLNLFSVSGLHQHSALMMLVSHVTFAFVFFFVFQLPEEKGGTFEESHSPCPLSPRIPDSGSEHTQFFLCVHVCVSPLLLSRKGGGGRGEKGGKNQ